MNILCIINYIATIISNLSNEYIHLYWTGTPTIASYGKCIGTCSIKSKNNRGNIISILHIILMIFVACLWRRGKNIHSQILGVGVMRKIGKIGGDKEFLSLICGKQEWESPPSILVIKNPN